MKYITITASTYEEAVQKARDEYGPQVRIHSRRDYTVGGGLFSRKRQKCDLTLYISEDEKKGKGRRNENDAASIREFEKEAQTPDPSKTTLQERLNTEVYRGSCEEKHENEEVARILDENLITDPLRGEILASFEGKGEIGNEIASIILDKISIAHGSLSLPKHLLVLMGSTGSGKTTTAAKIASLYKSEGKNVAIIALDSYRVGAFAQIRGLSDALGLPYELITAEDELSAALEKFFYYDLVVIDTMGLSPKDKELNLKLKGMLSILPRDNSCFAFVASASTKEDDLESQAERYSIFNPDVLVATKLDETESVGNVLSFSYRQDLPLMFFTNGQAVPEDIVKASTTSILSNLRNLGLDMDRSGSQVN